MRKKQQQPQKYENSSVVVLGYEADLILSDCEEHLGT